MIISTHEVPGCINPVNPRCCIVHLQNWLCGYWVGLSHWYLYSLLRHHRTNSVHAMLIYLFDAKLWYWFTGLSQLMMYWVVYIDSDYYGHFVIVLFVEIVKVYFWQPGNLKFQCFRKIWHHTCVYSYWVYSFMAYPVLVNWDQWHTIGYTPLDQREKQPRGSLVRVGNLRACRYLVRTVTFLHHCEIKWNFKNWKWSIFFRLWICLCFPSKVLCIYF